MTPEEKVALYLEHAGETPGLVGVLENFNE